MSRKRPGPKRIINDGRFVGAYITPELMTRLEVRATREMRSKAQMLRIYIEQGLTRDANFDTLGGGK